MNSIKKYWDYFSYLGLADLDREESLFRYRDIILVNRMVTILQLIMIVYIPIEIMLNGFELVFIIILQMLLVAITLLLNAKKKFSYSRLYFFITAILATGPFLLVTPREAGNSLMMLPVACIPVIIFSKLKQVFFGYFFVFGLFFLIDFSRDHVEDMIVVESEVLELMPRVFIIMLFIIFFALMFYFKHINLDYQTSIIRKSKELELSKALIEQHNKDITDSINYARRIQSAILPPEHFIEKFLKEYFILYKPKDIVAGDFYWAEHIDDPFFIAVADCTGHGVPGAMVSVVCSNALNRAVKEFDLVDPAEILIKTRELVVETFAKSTEEVKDGMDISLLVCHLPTKVWKWAGANNPLWMISNNELKEIKADKQPIGKTDYEKPFHSYVVPQDTTYVFLITDGFADQFGGPKGKKFKYSNLQKLLLDNINLEPSTLNFKLGEAFAEWKGDLEQVDDVCIIGIRLW